MFNRRLVKSILFLVIVAVLQGCVSVYQLPENIDIENLATITGSQGAGEVFVNQMDELSLDSHIAQFFVFTGHYKNVYKIAPGPHTFLLQYHQGAGNGSTFYLFAEATANIEPSKDYRVRFKYLANKVNFWIEEIQTGKNVMTDIDYQVKANG